MNHQISRFLCDCDEQRIEMLTKKGPLDVSIIVPLFNEEENVAPLVKNLKDALEKIGRGYEIILVNDGSTDGTEAALRAKAHDHSRLRVINFRRNFGQTAAMMAGIDHARGRILVPIDGDLQNDPRDICLLLEKLDDGYDVVSGWRRNRKDNMFFRTLPSWIANRVISVLSGVHLNDYGCTLKAYRKEVLEGFRLYGEMHRFVPIYASWQGARITEVAVRHHPRRNGKSKYGLSRIFKVLLDLLLVKFLTKYEVKPIYVFGSAGLTFIALAASAGLYAVYLKYFEGTSLIQTPLPLLAMMCFVTGVMCLLMGFLAEVLVRIYFEGRGMPHYTILSKLNFED